MAANVPAEAMGLTRPARALIGWMPPTHGEVILGGNNLGAEIPPEHRELAQRARDAVALRQVGLQDQADIITELHGDASLEEHVEHLRQTQDGAAMFSQGWRVAIADLTRVCAFQPCVFTDTAAERVQDVKADDLSALAMITLPTTPADPPRVQFDLIRQAYMVLSPNPNLRIVANFSIPLPDAPGAMGFGFGIKVLPSFMQVVQFNDRHFLRDGYHRAYGLLSQGITHVPVFTNTLQAFEELGVPAGLPQQSYLGNRPPALPDYLDDHVAATVNLPAAQKMIIIQGIALTPGG